MLFGESFVSIRTLQEKDPLLRWSGAYTIAMAYAGTGSNEQLQKLLHIAVSDVNDDVRRAAVISIGFLLFRQALLLECSAQLTRILLLRFVTPIGNRSSVQRSSRCSLRATTPTFVTVPPWHSGSRAPALVNAMPLHYSSHSSMTRYTRLFD